MHWKVIEHAGRPQPYGPSAFLAAPGGTIGRSLENHLVLPDEQRRISRLQAVVTIDDAGAVTLRNMGTTLPVVVNSRTLQHGEAVPISDGDRVAIGHYLLEARNDVSSPVAQAQPGASADDPAEASAPDAETPPAPAAVQAAETPQADDVPSPIAESIGQDSVFADIFGPGALQLGETNAAAPPEPSPPASSAAAHAPPDANASRTVAKAKKPAKKSPRKTASTQTKQPKSLPQPPPEPVAPDSASMPSDQVWAAILADTLRPPGSYADDAIAPPEAHTTQDPFSQPSLARRNPADPLAEFDADVPQDAPTFVSATTQIDPLMLFADDAQAPSPLDDPRPTLLSEEPALLDEHPVTALIDPAGDNGASSTAPIDDPLSLDAPFSPPSAIQPPAFEAPPSADPPLTEPFAAEDEEEPEAENEDEVEDEYEEEDEETLFPPPQPDPSVFGGVPLPDITAAMIDMTPPQAELAATDAQEDAAPPEAGELLQAFLEGAGVPGMNTRLSMNAGTMRLLGRLLRLFTDGTLELLSSRAMLKREVRAEITMIVDEENNPFKVLPNGRTVLMQMFGPLMPGFQTPEAAVHDAFADLQSHQLGMMAGMRAALMSLLDAFDPQRLEHDTPLDGNTLERYVPHYGRQLRLWRQLQQLHGEMCAAVADDFQSVFGRTFQRAYDEEMERLRETRRA